VRAKKRGGKTFYGCANYPQCDFKLWQKPIPEPCPMCAHPYLVVGGGKKNPQIVCPRGKECGYSRPIGEGGEGGEGAVADAPPPAAKKRSDSSASINP
jgi:DNA topoisomerase-1